MENYATTIKVNGETFKTLADIVPREPGLEALFVAKTPTQVSVDAGHYFQGSQGRDFWDRLIKYGLLNPTTEFEDESFLAHGYGLTDIVKLPRNYGNEPSDQEYREGIDRVLGLIGLHKPRVAIFVYKRVLDIVLELRFGIYKKASYGLNPDLKPVFGTNVFAFPLPGVGSCTREQAVSAMNDLKVLLAP
jgi:mismatch-specific thymine-DNA glycosylase